MAAGSRLNLMSSYESYARAVQRPTRLLKIETLGSVFQYVLILLKNQPHCTDDQVFHSHGNPTKFKIKFQGWKVIKDS